MLGPAPQWTQSANHRPLSGAQYSEDSPLDIMIIMIMLVVVVMMIVSRLILIFIMVIMIVI